MSDMQAYPIGTPGKKWGDAEKAAWLAKQTVQRSYKEEVLGKIEPLKAYFDVQQYGVLSYSSEQYPLFAVKTPGWDLSKPSVLVTGGVHGYETSGVQGAIRFLEIKAQSYAARFNLMVVPCVSPWGYETINRWNPRAIDPNRSFHINSQSEEAIALMAYLCAVKTDFTAHFDLHETTDTDNSEFRPALSARDAVEHKNWHIPDGFYLVDDTEKPTNEFQTAIIQSVEAVTHIAPADPEGRIIGEMLQEKGVIHYAASPLGLCMGITRAQYVTTTEVYPDSPKVDAENCINAQVAAIVGGLDYLMAV